MYYTSNGRNYFSLSADIFNSENKHKCKSKYAKMYLFDTYFSIFHISSDNVLASLKFCRHVGNIGVEGTVSQIIFLNPTFNLCQKTGNFLYIFLNIFSRFS